MNPQEQQMLDGLIERVRNTQLPAKDAEADRRIQDMLGRDPNALYILCQSVLVQGYALEQAQKQLVEFKQQNAPQPPQQEPTFLEKIFGRGEPDAAQSASRPPSGYGAAVYGGQPPQAQYQQPSVPPGYPQSPPAYYPSSAYPGGYAQQTGYGMGGGFGGGGFLQGALQTAAGVAMGELAFQSIEGLFRGFGHAAGYGSDHAMGFGDVGGANSGDYGQEGGFFSREQAENGLNDQLSPDIEDRRGESTNESHGFFGGDGSDSGDGLLSSEDSATNNGYDVDNSTTEDNGSDFTDDGNSFSDDN